MPQDPAVQVAIIGILTTAITTAGVVLVAFVNNRRERTGSADEGIAATLRERIVLRDEQIFDLKGDKAALQARLDDALARAEEQAILVKHLREQLTTQEGTA